METPEHALLECQSNTELLNIRGKFTMDITLVNADLLDVQKFGLTQCLRNLISFQNTVSRVSQLAYDVLEDFDSSESPIYVPATCNTLVPLQ